MAESSLNTIGSFSYHNVYSIIASLPHLKNNQQPVPTSMSLYHDGDLLVSLFSGQLWSYYGDSISFMPGDSKIAKVNINNGYITYLIDNLTTAIDVTSDYKGNIYVLEMTTRWPTPMINRNFDLYDPNSPPDPGGYARYSGRLIKYNKNLESVILADDLDAPTNITFFNNFLYVSVGQGTPGRLIWSKTGKNSIKGLILKVSNININ